MSSPKPIPHFDLMKVLGSIGVVILHSSVDMNARVDTHSFSWWLASIGNTASRYGDAIFIMVSGAILLARPPSESAWHFIKRRWSRLLPPIIFWSIFYFLWRQWMWGGLTWKIIGKDLIHGMPWYHMWFMFMLLGLYAIAPALHQVVHDAKNRSLQYIFLAVCITMTCIEAATQSLMHIPYASFLGLSPLFILYLVGGHLIYRDAPSIPLWILALSAISCIAAMTIGAALLYPFLGDTAFSLLYTNRGPFTIILTFCVFLGVLRFQPEGNFAKIIQSTASLTLGIYIIHPFWIDMLKKWEWIPQNIGPAWPITAIIVYFLSILSAFAISLIPGLRKVVSQ